VLFTRVISLAVSRGGNNPGTWAHQKLALKFAAWLSPHFELWVYDKIEELLKTGYTKLESLTMKDVALMLLASEEEKERLMQEKAQVETTLQLKEAQVTLANQVIQVQAPKVKFYDDVLQSQSLHQTTKIAADLGMTAIALNQLLARHGYIFKMGGDWVASAKIKDKDYMKSRTHFYYDSHGVQQSTLHFYWTERGRVWLMDEVPRLRAKEIV